MNEEMNRDLAIVDVMDRTEKKVEHLNGLNRNEYNGATVALYVKIINSRMNAIWLCTTKEEVLSFEEEYINDYYEMALKDALYR
jgi:hypothetical protein